MRRIPYLLRPAGLALCLAVLPALAHAQQASTPTKIEIPASAIALEGIPKVRIETGETKATRLVLPPDEAQKARLSVSVRNGEFYWTTRDNRPLRLTTSPDGTYLAAEPGRFIRLTRVNGTLTYAEHVELPTGSVTWMGELRIVLGK